MANGTEKDTKLGAGQHKSVLNRYGGEIKNTDLRAYIRSVGRKITNRTGFRDENWHFTVLDSPVVNAFALPGGYVYVTRGLLALANDEAELAGVLGHEIAHVTLDHVTKRAKRNNKAGLGVLVGTVLGGILDGKEGLKKGIQLGSKLAKGYVAQYSQKQEFEADQVGQRFLIAAGYDPLAQAEFLQSMGNKHALEARISGKSYNPNRVDIFASHPATGDRVARARNLAMGTELREFLRIGKADYMAAIDGMIYGDSPEQGFVRGRKFSHPRIGFEYEVPRDFIITNSASRVSALGPNGAIFNLDAGGKAKGSMENYLTQKWLPALAKKYKIGKLSGLKHYTSHGRNAVTAFVPIKRKGATWIAQLTVVELNGSFTRFTGLSQQSDKRGRRAMGEAAKTFHGLTKSEARRMTAYHIHSYRTKRGDRIDRLTRNMPYPSHRNERFLTLNGLSNARALQTGDLVKLIMP